MTSELRYRIESHPRAATLYVSGHLTVAGALRAARLCETLPTAVQALRVDLTAVRLEDATPIQALAMRLARWRRIGDGRQTRIELPPISRRPRPALPRPKPPRGRRAAPRAPFPARRRWPARTPVPSASAVTTP